MTRTEKYANPGIYLDTDDHGRLIEENREAYIREEYERTKQRVRDIERAMDAVSSADAHAELETEKERLESRLEELSDKLEHYRGQR